MVMKRNYSFEASACGVESYLAHVSNVWNFGEKGFCVNFNYCMSQKTFLMSNRKRYTKFVFANFFSYVNQPIYNFFMCQNFTNFECGMSVLSIDGLGTHSLSHRF